VKVYGEMASEYKAGDSPRPGGRIPYGQELDGREAYRSQQNCKGPKNQWNVHTEDFTPRHTKYDLKFGKIELFGYLGAGAVEFDDFVLKQLVQASPGDLVRTRKHSSATRVTLKEMEENERRSREAGKPEQDQATPPPPLRRRSRD
jgi:hypothetical protein